MEKLKTMIIKNKKKSIIISCVVLLILVSCIWLYMQLPVSEKDIRRRVPHLAGAEYKVKEIEVSNLQKKMGVQLFRVVRGGDMPCREYFLVNRMHSIGLLCFASAAAGECGDFVCADYDGDGEYEFLYISHDPFSSGAMRPTLYIYGTKGKKIQMEAAFSIEYRTEDNFSSYAESALKGGKDNKIYLYNLLQNGDSGTECSYRDGKWNYTGKLAESLELKDVTDLIKENGGGYAPLNLRDI